MTPINWIAAFEWVSRGFLFGIGLAMGFLVAVLIARMVSS